ncbi:ABC transporter ATP-binding protein [Alloalcanivorax gelatiniphagus]|uniref:ABC transporter ATP-binding protein n=1 Tax=Alloalcanivorax gelatiniphagus TaxID=1194167 RepID=A0ABY2XQV8_9GAMM|nr:ABC transporter ATP-binding protein [Alloalcanivorax gelatiniphagus]TMW14657.1 ABC transporter ATP-binding protein [Alloalcanivorax gelatiniphagus]
MSQEMEADNGIRVEGLIKEFPGQRVLDGLNLTVGNGEFVCLLGPSGCGKSTLLNILSGLDSDYRGSVHFGGRPMVPGGKPPATIGYLFQEPRLLPWLSAERNVDFALENSRVPRSRWGDIKDRYFALTGLQPFRDYYPHELSGGMAQRLSLVRALAIEPDVLFMDEPFSGLDELTARRLRVDLLDIWRETGKTILFITHNSYEATFLGDRVVVLSQGGIHNQISVDVPRPRDYDDAALFQVGKTVSATFIEAAEAAERARARGTRSSH